MALIITVKVVPSSQKQLWKLDKSGQLKCYLRSAPERGRANAELIKMIAHALKIPQSAVEIVAGETVRTKKIKIDRDINFEQFLSTVGVEKQLSLVD